MLGGHWPKLYAIAGVALSIATPPRAGTAGVTSRSRRAGTRPGPIRGGSPTAANLSIHPPPSIECFGSAGGSAEWAERGHSFAAYVLLGRKASRALAARARAVLDTLRVAPR